MLIEGAPGTGKTHLVRHLLSTWPGLTPATVTLSEQDSKGPHFLSKYLFPDRPEGTELTSEELTEETRKNLIGLSEPALIVVEDFHWADPVSAEVTWRALRRPLASPALIVLTMQPSARPWLLRLREFALSHVNASLLHLENFTLDEVWEAAEQISAYPMSMQTAELLRKETGGLPALVAHAAHWLADTPVYPGRRMDHAVAEMRRWLLQPGHQVGQPIVTYFRRLPPESQRVLEALAVAHSGRSAAALQKMVGNGDGHRQLQGLVTEGVVEYDNATYGYRLRYPSWRSTIQQLLSPERAAELHRAAASSGDEVENFCHLFEAAQLHGGAGDSAELATRGAHLAQQLEQRGNTAAAFELMRKALTLNPAYYPLEQWVRLGIEHNELVRLGDPDLLDVYSRISSPGYRQALCALVSLTQGEVPSAAHQLEQIDTGALHQWNEVQLFCHSAAAAALQGMFHGFHFPEHLIDAGITLLQEHNSLDEAEHLSTLLNSSAALARREDNFVLPPLGTPGAAAAHAVSAAQKHNRGEILQAGQQLFAACRPCSAGGDSSVVACLELSKSLFYAARWSESHTWARKAAERALETGESPLSLIAYATYTVVPCTAGNPQGEKLLQQLEQASALGSQALVTTLDFARSLTQLSTQKQAEAHSLVQILRDGRFPWSMTGLLPAVFFARDLAGTRNSYLLQTLLTLAANPGIPATAQLREYVETHIRGLMAGNPQEQVSLLLAAADHLDSLVPSSAMGRPEDTDWALPRALLILDIGKAYAAQRNHQAGPAPPRVKELLLWAEDTLRACGATGLTEAAQELVRHLQSPSGTKPNLALLTPREKEVTGLLAQGLTNREIADQLFVSVRTIEFHIQNTLRKLGTPTRKKLYAMLHRGTAH
nr:LuxR C-terminal-related transcriptional regulator [Nesterenkonia ebinurensis]